jgi:hypothetical protein
MTRIISLSAAASNPLEVHAKPREDAGMEHRIDEDVTVGAVPTRRAEKLLLAAEEIPELAGDRLNRPGK